MLNHVRLPRTAPPKRHVLIFTPRGILKRLTGVTRNAVDDLKFSAVKVLVVDDGEAFATVVEGHCGVGPRPFLV